jgi:hypothetical protein
LDTRGFERDVAQARGIIRAAHCSKTVKPVIVISKLGIGDRGEGFKKITDVLSTMFTNTEEGFECIDFVFTKFKDDKEEKEALKGKLTNIYETLQESGDFETSFERLMDHLGGKIDESADILIPDLLDQSKKAILIDKLIMGKKIEDPKSSF